MKEFKVKIFTVEREEAALTQNIEAVSEQDVLNQIYKNDIFYETVVKKTTYRITLAHITRIKVTPVD